MRTLRSHACRANTLVRFRAPSGVRGWFVRGFFGGKSILFYSNPCCDRRSRRQRLLRPGALRRRAVHLAAARLGKGAHAKGFVATRVAQVPHGSECVRRRVIAGAWERAPPHRPKAELIRSRNRSGLSDADRGEEKATLYGVRGCFGGKSNLYSSHSLRSSVPLRFHRRATKLRVAHATRYTSRFHSTRCTARYTTRYTTVTHTMRLVRRVTYNETDTK